MSDPGEDYCAIYEPRLSMSLMGPPGRVLGVASTAEEAWGIAMEASVRLCGDKAYHYMTFVRIMPRSRVPGWALDVLAANAEQAEARNE
jgi:hypothetical protein